MHILFYYIKVVKEQGKIVRTIVRQTINLLASSAQPYKDPCNVRKPEAVAAAYV